MVIHWFEVSFMWIWEQFGYPSFLKDFFHFTLFQEQEQQSNHKMLDAHLGNFQSAVSQSMPGILFLNNHSRSSASVKASRPLILKARKLFLCIDTWNLPVQIWAFWHIWGIALSLPWTESAFPCSCSTDLQSPCQASCLLLNAEINPQLVILAASLDCILSDTAFSWERITFV